MGLLSHNEIFRSLRAGVLPDDFEQRLVAVLDHETCGTCDGVRCMHFVLRDWWSPDFATCDGFCCPTCGEWERARAAAEMICAFVCALVPTAHAAVPNGGCVEFVPDGCSLVENAAWSALGMR